MQEIQSFNLTFLREELPEHHFAFCHVEAEKLDPNTQEKPSSRIRETQQMTWQWLNERLDLNTT